MFKHQAIKTPTVNPKDIIVKSIQAPSLTIQVENDAPPDEPEAITNLQAQILGNNKNVQTKDKTV